MKKKILALLSVICMLVITVFSSNLLIQAAGSKADQTATVKIDGLSIVKYKNSKGEIKEISVTGYRTIDIYRLIKLNFSEDGNSLTNPTHIWTDEMAEWLKGEGKEKYGKYLEEVKIGEVTYNAVSQKFKILQSDPENYPNTTPNENGEIVPNSNHEITRFYQDVASAIKGGTLKISQDDKKSKRTSGNVSSVSLSSVEMGSYLALYSFERTESSYKDTSIYYPIAVNVYPDNKTLELKSTFNYVIKHDVISLEKEVNTDDKYVYNGEEVIYTLKTTVPYYPENINWDTVRFNISDNWSKYLDLLGKETIKVLYADNNLEIKISNPNFFNVVDDIDNIARLEYTKDPYVDNGYETVTDKVALDSRALMLFKRELGDDSLKPLQGAEFRIRRVGEEKWLKFIRQNVKDANGGTQYLTYVLAADQNDPQATETIVMSDENFNIDKLAIRGLDSRKYEIEETKAPAGYIKPQGSFIVELINHDPGFTGTGLGLEIIDKGNYNVEAVSGEGQYVRVFNKSVGSLDLPITGGIGTMLFTVGGLAVMGGGIFLYIRNKKKSAVK